MTPRDYLRRYPLFSLLGLRRLDEWIASGQELAFQTGETIIQEGTSGAWAYLVVEGRVRILRRADAHREISCGVAGPGEVVGDYALLPPHCNAAACRAADPTRLLRLPLSGLQTALADHSVLRAGLKRWLMLHAMVNHLRGQAFLGFMSAPSAVQYLDLVTLETFHELRTIQADGLAADRWFFIQKGSIALHSDDAPLEVLEAGECFGERSLAGWRGLPVALALEQTECLCLARSAFDTLSGIVNGCDEQSVRAQAGPFSTYSWVGQQSESDCGIAALAMMALRLGREPPKGQLRPSCPNRGMNMLELQRLAVALGVTAQAVRVDANHLADATLPAIAHYADGHYVVLFDRSEGLLAVGDPATGIVLLTEREFMQHWSGLLLLCSSDDAGVAPACAHDGVNGASHSGSGNSDAKPALPSAIESRPASTLNSLYCSVRAKSSD